MHGNNPRQPDGERAARASDTDPDVHPRHRRDASSPASPVQSRREKWLLASMVAATVSLTAAIGPGFANASLDDYHVQR